MPRTDPAPLDDSDLDRAQAGATAKPEFRYVPVRRFMNDLPVVDDEVLYTGLRPS